MIPWSGILIRFSRLRPCRAWVFWARLTWVLWMRSRVNAKSSHVACFILQTDWIPPGNVPRTYGSSSHLQFHGGCFAWLSTFRLTPQPPAHRSPSVPWVHFLRGRPWVTCALSLFALLRLTENLPLHVLLDSETRAKDRITNLIVILEYLLVINSVMIARLKCVINIYI